MYANGILKFIVIITLLTLLNCTSKYKYTNKLDIQILKAIEEKDISTLFKYFDEAVELDYSQDAYTIFNKTSDPSDPSSEIYHYLFELKPVHKEKSWLSFREALVSSYKVEAENNEVNEDGSYFRNIHIYNETAYNRITLKCFKEDLCKITTMTVSYTHL
ncbi:MAG: hypothetical protein N3A69_00690, partial [Leptospiraceae bacterium]|nr:hypothetical protein [Leptospiraceae bacterium]